MNHDEKLKKLSQGKIGEVLKEFLTFYRDENKVLYGHFVILNARHITITKEYNSGIIKHEDYTLERNRISDSILYIVNNKQSYNFLTLQNDTNKTPNFSKFNLALAPFLPLLSVVIIFLTIKTCNTLNNRIDNFQSADYSRIEAPIPQMPVIRLGENYFDRFDCDEMEIISFQVEQRIENCE